MKRAVITGPTGVVGMALINNLNQTSHIKKYCAPLILRAS